MIVVDGKIVDQKRFPDGTLILDSDTNINPEIVEWYYENEAELLTLMYLDYNMSFLNADLYLMYAPNARNDKVAYPKTSTLRAFADIINSFFFKIVYIVEPHSDVIVNAIDNSIPEWVAPKAVDKILNINPSISHIVFPDKSSKGRFITECPLMRNMKHDIKYIVAEKHRNPDTGKIESYVLEPCDVANKDVLIVDDIISYGGTILKTIEELEYREVNNVYVYATHVEDSIAKGNIPTSEIEKIYCTNSMVAPNRDKLPNVIIIDIKDLL